MSTLLIVTLVIAVAAATYVVLLYTGKIKDKDGDFIPDVVEDKVEEIVEEVLYLCTSACTPSCEFSLCLKPLTTLHRQSKLLS